MLEIMYVVQKSLRDCPVSEYPSLNYETLTCLKNMLTSGYMRLQKLSGILNITPNAVIHLLTSSSSRADFSCKLFLLLTSRLVDRSIYLKVYDITLAITSAYLSFFSKSKSNRRMLISGHPCSTLTFLA